jgi:hypothetical protein
MKKDLKNLELIIDGNWYAPLHYLQEKENVVKAELIDTTSSAGDWQGYIIQKYNRKYELIFFMQENRAFGGSGFNLYVNKKPTIIFDKQPTQELLDEVIQALYEGLYEYE